MPYPIITPDFFHDLVNSSDENDKKTKYSVLFTPSAVEYFFPLNQEQVIKRLIANPDNIKYRMTNLKPEHEAEYEKNVGSLIEQHPILKYYWQLKTLMMNILQNRRYVFEKRMVILNFAMKTAQGMIDAGDEELIPKFVDDFTSTSDHDEVLKFFEAAKPNFAYSLCDGLAFLNTLPESDDYNKVLFNVFKTAGADRDLKNFKFDADKYLPVKKAYYQEFMKGREHYIEHIMVNYVWTACMPFADYRYSLWDNFVFFNVLFNAIKTMLTCYMYGDKTDDDFIFAVKAFDTALSSTKNIIARAVEVNKKEGLATNGDMAILAMS